MSVSPRLDRLLKYIDKAGLGIEVAPYFNPAMPKIAGHNVLILDVFDTEALRDYAAKDPLISADRIMEIEEVDVVGDASQIGEMVAEKQLTGSLSYVISSHNFEHLPNPVKFLRGCSDALKPGGMVSMAVPDCRACFDFFRFPTRLSDWLAAYHDNRSQPTPEQVFDLNANRAAFFVDSEPYPSCSLANDDPADFRLTGDIDAAYALYLAQRADPGPYTDTHCTIMFPETLELMLRDLRHLGLLDLEIVEITQTQAHEFFVHLRKPLDPKPAADANYAEQRAQLLRKITLAIGAAPYMAPSGNALKRMAAALIGVERYNRLRAQNRKRRAARHKAR